MNSRKHALIKKKKSPKLRNSDAKPELEIIWLNYLLDVPCNRDPTILKRKLFISDGTVCSVWICLFFRYERPESVYANKRGGQRFNMRVKLFKGKRGDEKRDKVETSTEIMLVGSNLLQHDLRTCIKWHFLQH